MKIAVFGAGYVGIVCAAAFASQGHKVICIDRDVGLIERLNQGHCHLLEPGLPELLSEVYGNGSLSFSSEWTADVTECEFIFLAVGTPAHEDGHANLDELKHVLAGLERASLRAQAIVIKSTVPPGTLLSLMDQSKLFNCHWVSNPEFLVEGAALSSFLKPHRILIGTTSERAKTLMRELYEPWVRDGVPYLEMSPTSAELAKYASNAMLASRVSFMNEIAQISHSVGASISEVKTGMMLDPRIGCEYLSPGPGFGGPCLPKDLRALLSLAEGLELPSPLLSGVLSRNELQIKWLLSELRRFVDRPLDGLHVGIWGLTFKAGTDDFRGSPAVAFLKSLLEAGALVKAYDPHLSDEKAAALVPGPEKMCFEIATTPGAAIEGQEVLCVMTDWPEFRNFDLSRLAGLMKRARVFDSRHGLSREALNALGIDAWILGEGAGR